MIGFISLNVSEYNWDYVKFGISIRVVAFANL